MIILDLGHIILLLCFARMIILQEVGQACTQALRRSCRKEEREIYHRRSIADTLGYEFQLYIEHRFSDGI